MEKSSDPDVDDTDPRVAVALAVFMDARDSGTPLDPDDWMSSSPAEIRPALRDFLSLVGMLPTRSHRPARRPPPEVLPDFPRYSGLTRVGWGGMGAVYRATDTTLGREVALKILHAELAGDPKKLTRFRAEARTASRLQHTHLVPVYDYGVMPGPPARPFFSMQLLPPRTLAEAIAEYHAKPTDGGRDALLRQFVAACGAVAYAHGLHVLHRDLKPANVMLGAYGEVVVVDWGLSTPLDRGDTPDGPGRVPAGPGESVAGFVRGTLAYMPPEQARGELLDRTADVFALGGVLCQVFTNRPLYEAGTPDELLTLAQKCATGAALTRLKAATVPNELLALVAECLAPDPGDRPISADAVGVRVTDYLASAERRARAADLRRALDAQRHAEERKRRRAWAAVVLSVVGVLVIGGYAGLQARNSRVAVALRKQAEGDRDAAETARDGEAAARAAAETARDEEKTARATAEVAQATAVTARDDARRAQAETEVARNALALEREKLARIEYGRSVQLAYQEARGGNLETARGLLADTRPDLRGWEWAFVHRLCHLHITTLREHRGSVNAVGFHPDGARILTGSDDGTAVVWNLATGVAVRTLRVKRSGVTAASLSADGTKAVTGGDDRVARVWDIATGAEVAALDGHRGTITSARFSPDGTRVVTASDDGTARVWDAATGKELRLLAGHKVTVRAAGFSPDGRRVVTGSDDGTARVWDADAGTEDFHLRGHDNQVTAAVFSPNGSVILTAGGDGTARLWDAKTGKELRTLTGHTGRVAAAAFSPDGAKVATGGDDKSVRVWDARSGTVLFGQGIDSPVLCVGFSPDGARVAAGAFNHQIHLWHAAGVDDLSARHAAGKPVVAMDTDAFYSQDGSRLFIESGFGSTRVCDAATGRVRFTLRAHVMNVNSSVACGAAGAELVTGGMERTLAVWDGHTGAALRSRRVEHNIFGVAVSPDGSVVVTGSDDGPPRLWNARTLQSLHELVGHVGATRCVAFHPDGTIVATGGDDGTVRLWDVRTGKELRELKGHTGRVRSVAFNLDGTRLVTGSHDRTARVWDTGTGAERLALRGHTEQVHSAEFNREGTRLVTGSTDTRCKVWDAETGAELLSLSGHTHVVNSVSFSPDGSRLLTAGGTVLQWDSTPVDTAFTSDRLAPPPRRVWRPAR